MMLPRYMQLACAANIVAALCLLADMPLLADIYTEASSDLMQDGPEMHEEIMDLAADLIRDGLSQFAPTLRKIADRFELPRAPVVPPAPRPVPQLAQDNAFDRLLALVNARGTKGVRS